MHVGVQVNRDANFEDLERWKKYEVKNLEIYVKLYNLVLS